ncbi:MAG TPA: amidohydrolase family protein [Burkholderiales bacterium]|nr:amidohydrolase family protein [Burkholderiales bacterium]
MSSRREFLGKAAGIAGLCFTGCGLLAPHVHAQGGGRRLVTVGGKRVKVIDVHAHAAIPEAMELAGQKIGQGSNRPDLVVAGQTMTQRIADMDAQGIDMEALSINSYWYGQPREVAEKIIRIQNEKLAELIGKHGERFTAFASVALQFPDLAAQQLQDGVKKYGLKGAAIGGSVAGQEISDAKFNPFWAKVEELGVPVFIHPQADGATKDMMHRFKGKNGRPDNVIGYPLETTIALSRLIFDGTLDRYPKLKIIGAHGGGFLPSYAARSDRGCPTFPPACPGGKHGAIKKEPSEYLKQMFYDTMVFTDEGLRHLIAEVGVSQLMVGTDYPFPWTKTAVDHVLNAPGLSDADKAAILEGNAAKALGLTTA